MKKKRIGYLGLILLLFLPSSNLFSDIGIKTGLSLSFPGQSELLFNPSKLAGIKGGLFYTFHIGENFSIQPGINYVKKGNQYYCVVCEGMRKANLDYLEIPLVFNIHLLNKTIDLFSGVYFGVILESISNIIHSWEGRDISVSNSDFGVSLGARYRFLEYVFVEVQFNQGLVTVIEEANQTAIKGHKNKTLSFLLGFGF